MNFNIDLQSFVGGGRSWGDGCYIHNTFGCHKDPIANPAHPPTRRAVLTAHAPLILILTQTRHCRGKYKGIVGTFKTIAKEEGMKGFTRGLGPRLMYLMPAASLTFAAYEQYKRMLGLT